MKIKWKSWDFFAIVVFAILFLIGMLIDSTHRRSSVHGGVDFGCNQFSLMQQVKTKREFQKLQEEAEAGDAVSQFGLAAYLKMGMPELGIKQDNVEAYFWLSLAENYYIDSNDACDRVMAGAITHSRDGLDKHLSWFQEFGVWVRVQQWKRERKKSF